MTTVSVANDDVFYWEPKFEDFAIGAVSKLPRRKSFNGIGCSIGVTLIGFVVILIAYIQFYPDYRDIRELETNGDVTDGWVIEKVERNFTYYVTFEYTIDGESYENETTVYKSFYERADVGQNIEVKYERNNPSNSDIFGQEGDSNYLLRYLIFIGIISGIITLLGLSVFGFSINKLTQMSALETSGNLIDGHISSFDSYVDKYGDLQVTVHYEFESPIDGSLIKGKKGRLMNNDLKGKPKPDVGTQVKILFKNNRNYILL